MRTEWAWSIYKSSPLVNVNFGNDHKNSYCYVIVWRRSTMKYGIWLFIGEYGGYGWLSTIGDWITGYVLRNVAPDCTLRRTHWNCACWISCTTLEMLSENMFEAQACLHMFGWWSRCNLLIDIVLNCSSGNLQHKYIHRLTKHLNYPDIDKWLLKIYGSISPETLCHQLLTSVKLRKIKQR